MVAFNDPFKKQGRVGQTLFYEVKTLFRAKVRSFSLYNFMHAGNPTITCSCYKKNVKRYSYLASETTDGWFQWLMIWLYLIEALSRFGEVSCI